MGITPRFTQADVHKMMQHSLQTIDKALIDMLSYLGEKCVNEARDFGDYQDQTSNLRSSVGYIIMVDGQVILGNFKKSGKGTDGAAGMEDARSFATSLTGNYPKGYALIVVAGMNYAAYVETRRNVLSTAEHLAQAQLPRMMSQLKSKLQS